MRFRLFGLALIFVLGCKDPYTPKVISGNRNYLVVDGFINADANTTTRIRLTRTTNVNDTAAVAAEHGASVSVSQDGNSYALTETGDSGYYETSAIQLVTGNCQLHIQTADQQEYQSDDIPVLTTPPIDTVYYARKADDGVQIYLDTHDHSNTIKNFRWDYDETWEYHPPYQSSILYDWSKRILSMRSKTNRDSLYNCYETGYSSDILIYSTQALSESQVSLYPIAYIPSGSIKLSDTYTIHIKEYAISDAAYDYFNTLKKTTQDIGNVFGPMPTQLKGNIHAVNNPNAVVIGYMTASTVTDKRLFIYHDNLTSWKYSFDYDTKYLSNYMSFPGYDTPLDEKMIYFMTNNSPCPEFPPPPPCSDLYNACCPRAIPVLNGPKGLQYCYDTICVDCIFWGKGGRRKPDYWPY